MALKYRYPRNLEHKLHQRKGNCYTKLGKHDEARKALKVALSTLDLIPKLTADKKDSMTRDINALMAETEKSSQRLSQDEPQPIIQLPPTVAKHGDNEDLPGRVITLIMY